MQLHLQVLVITAITSTVCDLTNNGPTQILFQFEMSLKTFLYHFLLHCSTYSNTKNNFFE